MTQPIQLIVGLANPGKEYEQTRHNAGAWFIEAIANQLNTSLRMEAKYHGLHGLVQLHGQTCHLLIPSTFMNLSGQSVRACMSYHKIPADTVLIAHDEIDLPAGVIKLKFDGGDGGHNGLKDIIRHLSTKQFYRLRIGVGRPSHGKDVADYVLDPPSKAERHKIDDALLRAQEALPLILRGDIQKAMLKLHTETPL
ncbi:Peptidyl-tRNA hydrolase [Aquicella siphonis]|uniref:Peptidyl-tRNA hydrolase n=1 Tax=Aquicella siphonis TaxID=254247 RepID=A0A5E4PJZ4_9COXI|nr:aminoacyl-tRNA hydrolase [Aquicella siphonis]VVC76701.1 Peptidyl-tRNA hydrolase [Aquicella siphonis]